MAGVVYKIFESMSYGDFIGSASLGKEWLRGKEFGPFIGGTWDTVRPEDASPIAIDCMGESLVSVFSATIEDVDKAVTSCLDVSEKWHAMGSQRENYLLQIVKHLEKHATLLAQVEALERQVQLKDPVKFDVPALISWFKYYANWVPVAVTEYAHWKPYGVVAAVTTLNSPLFALAWLIAPVLAAGNCVCVYVPSETCLTAMLLARIFIEAGLPSGVVNILPGNEDTITELVLHKAVKNTRAFGPNYFVNEIKQKLSDFPLKTISMMMSGRTPMLVFDSCDIDSAIESAVRSAWYNQGSAPWSVKLLLVQESIFQSFEKKLKQRINSLRVGGSFDKMADVGKPYDPKVVRKIAKIAAEARANGTEVFQTELSEDLLAQGFFPLTLVVGGEARSNQVIENDDFPPVITVVPFRTAKEALALANNSRYGFAASVWSNKLTLALDVSDRLQFGTVWINCHGALDPSVSIQGWKESGGADFGGKSGLLDCLYLQKQTDLGVVEENANLSSAGSYPLEQRYKVERAYKLYYAGQFKQANGNAARSIVIDNDSLFTFCDANRKDVRMAVEAATNSLASWSRSAVVRVHLLNNIAAKIEADKKKLISHMEAFGTVQGDAVDYVVSAFKYWASVCDKSSTDCGNKPGFTVTSSRHPLGVVGIGIYTTNTGKATRLCEEPIWQLAAALSFGNPVVVVVDMENPSGCSELFKSICEVSIPSGVLSVLTGSSFVVMKSLAEHQSVQAIFHWNYPRNLVKVLRLAAGHNSKRERSCIVEQLRKPGVKLSRECTEMSVTRMKAVYISKGEIFAN